LGARLGGTPFARRDTTIKLFLINRNELIAMGRALSDEFDNLVHRIRSAYHTEHREDDSHGHVHAQSIATGRLTLSDIATATTDQARLDNYAPDGLKTAAILRLNASVSTVLTGITIPQDEKEVVIDGRVLVIENTSDTTFLELSHEDTNSVSYNRFLLPFNPSSDVSARLRIAPRSTSILQYNSKAARWVSLSQNPDNIVASYTGATTADNDFAPAGLRSASTLLIDKTVKSATISGFDSIGVPVNARKRIINNGLYSFDILHANVNSLVGNRVYCPGQTRYRLHPREAVELYQQTEGGWKLVACEKADQWVDVSYASGNFTTDAGTWTVDSGDQITYAYHLDGNKMTIAFDLRTTSIATNPTILKIAIPGARIVARDISSPILAVNAGTQISTAYVIALTGQTTIWIVRDVSATAWSAATNTTRVWGQVTFFIREDSTTINEPHTDVAAVNVAHADLQHSDVQHLDVSHGDSHGDSSHQDQSHQDVSHVDETTHNDQSHVDQSHVDLSHSDTPHQDTDHEDVANTHDDTPHSDHDDLGSAEQHWDDAHGDGGSYHSDTAHSDVTYVDAAHSDTAHSDTDHGDSSSHSDTAHNDQAHVDGGHGDTHSDTVPHADVAHVDVAAQNTAHGDSIHSDTGPHLDTTHVDI
jgi:hypothetical protein